MKIKAVSGIVCLVKDAEASADFYEGLGFVVVKRNADVSTVRSNWFWIDLVQVDAQKNTGNDTTFIYLSVDDINQVYADLHERGLQPTNVTKYPSGRHETMITDPDGYRLVFFQK